MKAKSFVLGLVAFGVALGAMGGCSHEVESPPVGGGSPLQPDLACVAQLTTRVTMTGSGFTPMSSKALSAPEQLILPKVGLSRVKAIDGTDVTDPTVVVPDDPANPAASHVFWASTTQMSFDVFPDLKLATGLYDITVTNPDGVQKASFAASFGAMPPPSAKQLVPPAICDDEADRKVTIQGADFLQIGAALPTVTAGGKTFTADSVSGCAPVPGTYTEGAVQLCTSLTFTVPKGTFTPGDYPVTVTNPAPANCVSSEVLSLHDEPPPIVTKVAPATVCEGGGKLTIDGSNFIATPTVSLESQSQSTVTSNSVVMNTDGTQLTALIPGGATVGATYDVVVTNPDGCTDNPPHQTVTVKPGPIVFMADPEIVYNGVNMIVTVYMTTAYDPTSKVTIVPTGQSSPVTVLTTTPVAGHANRFQATIPKGQAPGVYDLIVEDTSAGGCIATLPKAFTVTKDLTITLKNVVPPFGWTSSETSVTVFRDTAAAPPGDHKFFATPRAFLIPNAAQPTDVAIPLQSVSFVDSDTITAVVPKGQPAKVYDLIVTDPDGAVGYLAKAYTVTTNAPPVITSVVPSSIIAATNQKIVLNGTDFRAGALVTMTCRDSANNNYTPTVVTGTVTATSAAATVDASSVTGTVPICVVRITNTDGTYGEYSAVGVTNSSLNLEKPPIAGTAMTTARRALVASAVDATEAARFVYAIGGDSGQAGATTPFNTSEFASVGVYGKMGAWTAQKYDIGGARSFAGATKIGRYTYIFGGSDGANALKTARRGMTLSPREVPSLDIDDLVLASTGLDTGYWMYRVSATFSNADLDNPGGESLASDEFIVKLPAFAGKKIQVKLAWDVPRDSLAAALPNVTGYRIYRTAVVNGASGTEVLLGTSATTSFTDDGSAAPQVTEKPLPLGSMGKWLVLPDMGTARKGPAGASGVDPVSATTYYVYALLGLDGANAESRSYDYLPVTVLSNGHQTVGNAWKAGANLVATGRWQAGAWTASSLVSSSITAPTNYVYVGGGITAANGAANAVDVGLVASGGDLGAFTSVKAFPSNAAGYGVCAANDQLFTFGGSNHAPSSGATSATITTAPTLAPSSWNSEGVQLLQPRYLMGSSVQSAFIFLIGGDTGGGVGSTTTELIVW